MAQTAAHLVDHGHPHVPVRQWVLSLPIPLRLLLAAQPQPQLLTPVLQVVQRVLTRCLRDQAGLKADEGQRRALVEAVGQLPVPWRPGGYTHHRHTAQDTASGAVRDHAGYPGRLAAVD